MEFIDNYRGGPLGAICMTPDTKRELIHRLESGQEELVIEDLFESETYKTEKLHISNDWKTFEDDTGVTSKNIIYVVTVLIFALMGVYSIF